MSKQGDKQSSTQKRRGRITSSTNQQNSKKVPATQHPANNDTGAWKAYWKEQGQPWRTKPEIDMEQQTFLEERRSIMPDIFQGNYPFGGIKLSRADVEWLLATHWSSAIRGPVDWSNESQRERDGLDLRGADLCEVNLSGLPLARMIGGLALDELLDATEEQRNMAKMQLQKADLREAQMQGANLREAQLQSANLEGAQLQEAELWDAQLQRAGLSGTQLQEAVLSGAQLQKAHLWGAQLQRAWLKGAQLQEANLSEAELQGANLEGAQLQEAELWDAQLQGTNLEGAQLQRAHLRGQLQGANLSGAQLQEALLSGAQLQGANLSGAQLQGANLEGAQLQKADLSRADLEDAKLDGVTLSDQTYGSARLVDIHWGEVNLAVVDWRHVTRLGEEQEATQKKDFIGKKSRQARVYEYKEAVRANRQLAVVLSDQGLNEEADHFAYRALILQRKALWWQIMNIPLFLQKGQAQEKREEGEIAEGEPSASAAPQKRRFQPLLRWFKGIQPLGRLVGAYLFSAFLAMLTGYGFRMGRIILAYILLICGFAAAFWSFGIQHPRDISIPEALIVSVTAFHGRVFTNPFMPNIPDAQILITAIEAVFGLVIEGIFIAMLTQRFFRR